VEEKIFTLRTGLLLDRLEPALSQLRHQGLIEAERLGTTEKGLLFLNNVLERFTS
jgi:coproporphyrinogen III oxidase-like Fe-S oxidoreductase